MTKKKHKGKRKYGAWAGNPNGIPEDTTRCIETVSEPGRGVLSHQCGNKRGYGKDGLYCKIHDPEYVKAKRQAEQNKWEKKRKAESEELEANARLIASAPDMYEALKKIQKQGGWVYQEDFDSINKALAKVKDK